MNDERPIDELLAETVANAQPDVPVPRPDVFSHLIEGDTDLIGIVAYSIYKREKRDWMARWEQSHDDVPTANESEAFVLANLTEGQKERYRLAARAMLETHAGEYVHTTSPEGDADAAAATRLEDMVDRVEHAAESGRRATLGNLVAAGAIGAVTMILLALGGWYGLSEAGIDLSGGASLLGP